nr:MAG TPA: hypothetical protein [Caudoviricetes sp.]
MNAIGLNPIKLDAIGLDPIRMNAIRLGVPVASSGSGRPYIDPELLSHVKMAISTWGKTNDDPDRAVLKDLTPNGNDMRLLNFGFAEGSGYGLPGTDFEGWLCTDGVDDIIESVKPVSEMLEGSNEITVVSIIHQISTPNANNYTNVIRTKADSYGISITVGKDVSNGKTGIYGYTVKEGSATIINSILGDKADYTLRYNNINANIDSKFFVQGWYLNGSYRELSQIAYAGGFIANKVLTTDEINQIISYFNLDRPGQIIKPQLYYNIKKQGITNENHAEFNDQLIDFINGHNIQLNNIGWEGESGIIDGALYLDGISDFGKATGLPVLKDYTVVAERGISNNNPEDFGLISDRERKNDIELNTFVFEKNQVPYAISFGMGTSVNRDDSLKISYQSKYSYNGESIVVGGATGNNILLLGAGLINNDIIKEYVKAAVRFLMLFPYSLSEFLLERQLRKYKAGTLYPDMIEFRPIVKSNIPYSSISYSVNPGVYVTEGSTVTITITLSNASDKLVGVSSNAIGDISISGDNGVYEVTGKVTKSPQKINIVISSYLTMLNNDTLISNETLIKNE